MRGTIIKSTGSWYNVLLDKNKVVACRVKGLLRLDELKTSNPVAVGDWVEIALEDGQETGIIGKLYDRNNYIIRSDPHKKSHRHILAANLDQAMVVASLKNPRVPAGFIDRFSVTAEAYHIPVILVFNKADIYEAEEMKYYEELKNIYEGIGYKVILTSAIKGIGTEPLKELLINKTTLLAGQSGVGKSATINSICPELTLRTKDISNWNEKGQHTTTFAEMHPLTFGGFIIDTPGVKEFGMMDLELDEVSHYFPEMRRILNQCKFNNCRHLDEPGCAVKEAVNSGAIHPQRFNSYLNIIEEIETGLKFWQKK